MGFVAWVAKYLGFFVLIMAVFIARKAELDSYTQLDLATFCAAGAAALLALGAAFRDDDE